MSTKTNVLTDGEVITHKFTVKMLVYLGLLFKIKCEFYNYWIL